MRDIAKQASAKSQSFSSPKMHRGHQQARCRPRRRYHRARHRQYQRPLRPQRTQFHILPLFLLKQTHSRTRRPVPFALKSMALMVTGKSSRMGRRPLRRTCRLLLAKGKSPGIEFSSAVRTKGRIVTSTPDKWHQKPLHIHELSGRSKRT